VRDANGQALAYPGDRDDRPGFAAAAGGGLREPLAVKSVFLNFYNFQ
jgi:hypothetical protein